MKNLSICGFILALFWSAGWAGGAYAETADLILTNGKIYTANDRQKWAGAVAVRDGKIIYVGDNGGSAAFKSDKTKLIDLKGKLLLPGFIDGHNHVYGMASVIFSLNLPNSYSVAENQAAIRAYRARDSQIKQILGIGWDNIEKQAMEKGVPPKQLIDEAAADIPVAIADNSAHNLFVNSKALEIAGIKRDTPDPAGGVIVRDGKGDPVGILREFAAQNMVINALPQPDFTEAEFRQAIRVWQKKAAENGITAAFVPFHYPGDNVLKAFKTLDKNKELTAYYDLALWADESKAAAQIAHLKQIRSRYQGRNYKIDSVKIFSDGIGAPKFVWKQEDLEKTVAALDKEHFRVFVHAIGNPDFYPSHNVLNAYAYAQKVNGARDSRHAITHLDWVMEEDVPRFRELGVFAVPQAVWFGKDWYDNVPADKVPNKQRFKSFINAGVTIISSSDFPATDTADQDMYPLTGIEIGMTRLAPGAAAAADKKAGEAREKASLEDMIASYTINGAKLLFAESDIGSVETGKKANFTVLDKDLFAIPAQEISRTKVLMTIFEGREIYRSPDFN